LDGGAVVTKLVSEQIRERVVQLQAQRAYVLESGRLDLATEHSAIKDALTWALELVEAQERESEWTEFAERMPEPPEDDTNVTLLVRQPRPTGNGYFFTAFDNSDGEWGFYRHVEHTDSLKTAIEEWGLTHWRLVRGPGVGGDQ
jgi:hypothetical protein